MKITLLRNVVIDIDNIPDNFEDIIAKSFGEYTSGTNPDYMYHDKLCYLDRTVMRLHRVNGKDAVKDSIKEQFAYQLDEYGELTDPCEFLDVDYMQHCYELGLKDHDMYSYTFTDNRQDNDKIMKILIRIIKAVMNYGGDTE